MDDRYGKGWSSAKGDQGAGGAHSSRPNLDRFGSISASGSAHSKPKTNGLEGWVYVGSRSIGPSKPIPKGPRLIMEEEGRESAVLGSSKPIPKGPRLIMEEEGRESVGLGPHSGLFSFKSPVLFSISLVGQDCEAGGLKMVGVFKETQKGCDVPDLRFKGMNSTSSKEKSQKGRESGSRVKTRAVRMAKGNQEAKRKEDIQSERYDTTVSQPSSSPIF